MSLRRIAVKKPVFVRKKRTLRKDRLVAQAGSNQESTPTEQAEPAADLSSDEVVRRFGDESDLLKVAAFLILIASCFIAVAEGGSQDFLALRTLVAIMSGGIICIYGKENTRDNTHKWGAGLVILWMALSAISIVWPLPDRPTAIGFPQGTDWFVYKLVYVAGIAVFGPILVEPLVKKGLTQIVAFVIAILLQMLPYYAVTEEHRRAPEEQRPDAPWYRPSMLLEDVTLGLQVVLLIAAYNARAADERKSPYGEEEEDSREGKA